MYNRPMKYEKPPLVEVVIEIRFNSLIEHKKLEKFAKKVKNVFVRKHDQFDVDISLLINADKIDKVQSSRIQGFRLETAFADYILIASPSKFSLSVLNPYPGWDTLFEKFCTYWQDFKSITGCHDIIRVACLSVNRIDIPLLGNSTTDNQTLNIDDFLNIGIKAPKGIILEGYQAIMGVHLDDSLQATVTTATAPPLIPNYAALALNIDVFQEKNIPQNNEGLFARLEKIHISKNKLFKEFVTEKSEELFIKVL